MNLPANLSFRSITLVSITLTGLVLGGATELWEQALIVLLAAVAMVVFPPRHLLALRPALILLAFVILGFSAFLPANWGSWPDWRRHLVDLQAPLGSLRTPQPWITLQACGLMVFGAVWIAYLFVLDWKPGEKSGALRLLVGGIIVLAAASIATFVNGWHVVWWTQEQNRGWFPNRNQTADVLALAGVLNYVIAFKRLQKRNWSGPFWIAGLAVITVALVISFSRAGILLFFGGIGLWHLGSFSRAKGRQSFAFGLSAMLLLLSLFLLFGGATLERFFNAPAAYRTGSEEYRMLIQRDALKVSLVSPLLGVGLANFEPVFTSMRDASADQNRTLHPESDWLWMAIEMGWLAPLLLIAGVLWWGSRCLPFELKAGEALRKAAVIASIMFLLHGFVDVSGHRTGSFLVAMFLMSTSLSSRHSAPERPLAAAIIYRALALVLACIGGWWLVSIYGQTGPPTTATLARLQAEMDDAATTGRIASLSQAANAALEIAPLDWTCYFRRASAEALRTGGTELAVRDFAIARYLEPHWVNLCVNEGEVWLAAEEPDRCADAWNEALRRAGSNGAATYARLLGMAQDYPSIHQSLAAAANTNVDYLITFLNYATPAEGKAALDGLLARDPGLSALTSGEEARLFAAWNAHGDADALAQQLLAHSDWQAAGWKFLALHFAAHQDFQMASLTTLAHLPQPEMSKMSVSELALADLQAIYQRDPENLANGLMLAQAQMENSRDDDALATLGSLQKLKDCPRYIFYLQAELYVKKQEWEQAWNALAQSGVFNG